MDRELTDRDYRALLEFRSGLRRFLRWSETQAQAAGLTARQHQLLLAIRGSGGDPSISEVAERLVTRHHSVVGLVDRAQEAGLVERVRTDPDQRLVRLRLTEAGAERLARLTALHREELARLGPRLAPLWHGLERDPPADGNAGLHC